MILRAATLPGSELVLPIITKAWVTGTGRRIAGWLDAIGLEPGADITEFARGFASLADPEARHAFICTARSVIDHAASGSAPATGSTSPTRCPR